MPDETPDLDLRKEWTRLRALLYETHELALTTDQRDGHRWLTDRYVLLDVTDSMAAEGVPDGCYKLVQARGFEPRTHEFENETLALANYLGGGIVDYLEGVERGAVWRPVFASEWSVAEHPGKAMLLSCDSWPVLMGEQAWTTLHRHYDNPLVQYDRNSARNLFRVRDIHKPMDGRSDVVAYVAGIRIPEGQEVIAKSIAKLVDIMSTSN